MTKTSDVFTDPLGTGEHATLEGEHGELKNGTRVLMLEQGQGWLWQAREYVSRLELHNTGPVRLYVVAEETEFRPTMIRVRAQIGELEQARLDQINEGLQAAGELARAVITAHGNAAAELAGMRIAIAARARLAGQEPSNLVSDLELLASAAQEFTRALDALPYTNACCGHPGRVYEDGRECCSRCDAESPAKRWL